MHSPSLNPRQEAAVRAPQKPLLIVAGAGTGKTRTLVARLLRLLKAVDDPRSLCAITFTNKAAREVAERVAKFAGREGATLKGTRSPFIGTFHSLGARILRHNPRLTGRTGSFAIFDEDDSLALIRKILKRTGTMNGALKPAGVTRKVSAVKNGSRSLSALQNSRRSEERALAEVFLEYEKALEENNAFDFDDLLVKAVALLSANPAVRRTWERRFAHILVDEYQDINRAQYELLKLLAGTRNAVTVVGDDSQTIYGWRGSDVEIFLDFESHWPEATVMVLNQNYRSTPTIIAASSALIARNARQKLKELWTENPDGEKIVVWEAGDEDEEAEWVAEKVQDSEIKNQSESTAVLYRTNAQSRAVEQALIARNIAYQVFGGVKFYERREVRDIVAALRCVANPRDTVSRERLEKTFYRAKTAAVLDTLADCADKKPAEVIEAFLAASRYADHLDAHFTNADERKENIAELLFFAASHNSLAGFLESVSLLQPTDAPARRRPAVKSRAPVCLMTVHLAKGLEFDRVFVVGCREDVMPHALSLGNERQLEEERRLMYVAMTRAKKKLFISFYDVPSRFLLEIPEEFVAFRSFAGGALSDDEEKYVSID